MKVTTRTLTEFLLARICEDEAAARECIAWVENAPSLNNCDTHHDPNRALAECEAKRQIVEWSERWVGGSQNYQSGVKQGLHAALVFLALPYADHPDYDEAWRP